MIMSSSLIMIKVNNYLNFGELQGDLFLKKKKHSILFLLSQNKKMLEKFIGLRLINLEK